MSVMNVRRETKSVSRSEANAPIARDSGIHTTSATDFKQAYGEQNVGEVLNKVADPNYIDPAKKLRATGNNQLDKDAFLKLMLTQMKYQDPTNPMQSHEMAAQLAQFTSLEQLNNIHMTLESMKNQQAPQSNFQALALIGKRVSGDSSKLNRAAGDTKHGIAFELLGDAAKVRVTIKDSTGAVVRKLDFGDFKKGASTVEWNGVKDDGSAARPGEYKVSVEGTSSAGKKVFAKTDFSGRITGLNYTPEGPVLLVGTKTIKLTDVKKIEDSPADDGAKAAPAAATAAGLRSGSPAGAPAASAAKVPTTPSGFLPLQQPAAAVVPPATVASANSTAGAPRSSPKVADDNVPPAEEAQVAGNIDSVPMASELLNQVARAQ